MEKEPGTSASTSLVKRAIGSCIVIVSLWFPALIFYMLGFVELYGVAVFLGAALTAIFGVLTGSIFLKKEISKVFD